MKPVFSAETLPAVAHMKNVLEAEGIACTLRNENIGSVMGEIPFVEIWPELWVADERDLAEARAIVERERREPTVTGPPWVCRHCQADNDAHFFACWRCSEPVDE